MKYSLGIKIVCGSEGKFLYQWKYGLEIIDECGLLGAKSAQFPMEENHKLVVVKGSLLMDLARYRGLISHLIALTISWPNLNFAVHILFSFCKHLKRSIRRLL